ncbi:MAG: radical SAM family heme chaperone HemW [Candidatus Delongbacteria bacterium]|jgi:oxygen-independent coproporphyrinogen-3 oxidase|nr:radical SAM family heme chaperone HemW [Candidatus Delongbacteria bacterium]
MPGIYIHIPFCRRKCAYCDFYSVALLNKEPAFVNALTREITSKANDQPVETIYFGGGTPSILSKTSIERILNILYLHYRIVDMPEITIEANPDDITSEKARFWLDSGINRLSIGVQSLDDDALEFLGRRHNAKTSLQSIKTASQAGFENMSADLIYNIPGLSLSAWETNLDTLLDTGITHLSAYQLTIEPGTLLGRKLQNRKFTLPEDESAYSQFMALYKNSENRGMPWYEISNFAQEGFKSRHNSSYWNGDSYFGFGPGAHAYDGKKRRWNIPDLNAYIENPLTCYETETLSPKDNINDYLITRLRTREGINVKFMEQHFNAFDIDGLKRKMEFYLNTGKARYHGDCISLTPEGLFISDAILKDIIYL